MAPVHLSQGRSVVSAAPHTEDYVLTDKIIDSYLADSQPISEQNTHVLQLPYGPPSDSRTQSDACTRSNAQSSPSSHWSSTARPPSSWVEVSRQVQEERERQQEWALLREQNEQMLHQRQQQNYQDTARMEKEETELPLKQLPSALYTSAKRLRAATLLLQRRQGRNSHKSAL